MLYKKIILTAWIIMLSLTFPNILYVYSLGETPPFSASEIGMGNTTAKGPVTKDQKFSVDVNVKAWNDSLTNIKMGFSIPQEVELWKGNLNWEGDMNAKSEKMLIVDLTSKTDWTEWSSPIKAHVELYYEGRLYTRHMEWSSKGYVDTCWQGGEIAAYANRWCVKKSLNP
jgi:hypothetical protein